MLATVRQPQAGDRLKALGVVVYPLDVTDGSSVSDLSRASADEAVDVLVNNAGIGTDSKSFEELEFGELSTFFEVNSIGALRVTKALLPNLRRGERKLVVNISSMMGSIGDNTSGEYYGYRASKAALNMLTRSLAIDLAPQGFTCVVLHPGWVQTDMGGPDAPLKAVDSVAGMLRVIDGLSTEDNGGFLDYNGNTIPW